MPYDGAHLYPRSATELLLETKAITTFQRTGRWHATMVIPPHRFREAAVGVQECVEQVPCGHINLLRELSPDIEDTCCVCTQSNGVFAADDRREE